MVGILRIGKRGGHLHTSLHGGGSDRSIPLGVHISSRPVSRAHGNRSHGFLVVSTLDAITPMGVPILSAGQRTWYGTGAPVGYGLRLEQDFHGRVSRTHSSLIRQAFRLGRR